jgi:hypothetical protein
MLFVHGPRRDIAGVARTVRAGAGSKDELDRSLEYKEPRVKIVRMSVTMHVWFDFAFPELIAIAPKVSLKLGSIHHHFPPRCAGPPRTCYTMGQHTREVEPLVWEGVEPGRIRFHGGR